MHTIQGPSFLSPQSPGRVSGGWRPLRSLQRVLDMVFLWHARATQRAALAALDDRMLKDIGVSRAQAAFESRKPFWRT